MVIDCAGHSEPSAESREETGFIFVARHLRAEEMYRY